MTRQPLAGLGMQRCEGSADKCKNVGEGRGAKATGGNGHVTQMVD